MRYSGTVPQAWVDKLAPMLSRDVEHGKVLAEECFRDELMRPVMVKWATGAKLSATEAAQLPVNFDGQPIAQGGE